MKPRTTLSQRVTETNQSGTSVSSINVTRSPRGCPRRAPAAAEFGQFARRCRSPAASAVLANPRRVVEQRLDDAPGFLDRVLVGEERAVAGERRLEENLVRGRALAALLGELHLAADRLRPACVGAMCFEDHTEAGARIDSDDELVRLRLLAFAEEREWRRGAKDKPELGLGDREVLPGSDVERDALPALVVDPELERRV